MSQLDHIALWHRIYSDHLAFVFCGVAPDDLDGRQIGNAESCQLGQWLEDNKSEYVQNSDFQNLITCHTEFHDVAAYLVQTYKSVGFGDQAHNYISHLHAVRNKVLEAIMIFEKAVATKTTPSIDVVSNLFAWTHSRDTGILIIDDQHQAIAELGRTMMQRGNLSLDSEEAQSRLQSFLNILSIHFDTEELHIKKFPLSEDAKQAHINEHTALLEKLISLFTLSSAKLKSTRLGDLGPMLMDIIFDHITRFDLALKPYSKISLPGDSPDTAPKRA